jgi:hypothetical protein
MLRELGEPWIIKRVGRVSLPIVTYRNGREPAV